MVSGPPANVRDHIILELPASTGEKGPAAAEESWEPRELTHGTTTALFTMPPVALVTRTVAPMGLVRYK